MNRIATPLFLIACLALLPGSAAAGKAPAGIKQILGIAAAASDVVIPQEWGGIWTSVDSTYGCLGDLQFVDGAVDTLCPGAMILDPGVFPVTYDCTGSADASTVSVTCSGSAEVFPGCVATYSYSMQGTRTGDSYLIVSNILTTYSGSAEGCNLIPDDCMQINSRGTRTGPVPTEYCETPALPASWGQLKVRYR